VLRPQTSYKRQCPCAPLCTHKHTHRINNLAYGNFLRKTKKKINFNSLFHIATYCDDT